MTLDSKGFENKLASKKKQKQRISKLASGILSFNEADLKIGTLQNIPEKDEIINDEDDELAEEKSDEDGSASGSDDDDDSEESSIDMDADDEEKLYDKFLNL